MGDDEKTWDQRIFDLVDPGIDLTLIDEALRLTPTERIERMRAMLQLAEDIRQAGNDHGLSSPP
jgi:hypothetical protein